MSTPSRSGVFQQATDRRVEQFTESISYDRRLYKHDIRGSIAHAQMLAQQGIITEEEARQIEQTLRQIEGEIDRALADERAGRPAVEGGFQFQVSLEDIHMHIEQALIKRLGDVGRKLHTGRSRNDQIATDLRLWARDEIDRFDVLLRRLQAAFVGRCDRDGDLIMPAYTHLQRAQPVMAAHYWLAYCEKFERDRSRLADCRRRLNVNSLGAAALAGTSLPIDRHKTSELLGFDEVARNSLDVSNDRDFVLELAFVLTLVAEHLSTLAEEWILWSTAEFNFIRLPQAFCTGSSIMPQKINPDVLELIRGKTARVIGNLQSLLVLVKGLPLAYNRDLQEDKLPLFDSVDTVAACLELAAEIVAGAELNREAIAGRLDRGYLDATALMEHFIRRGMPQRTAHHLIGAMVGKAMRRGVPLDQLTLEELRQASLEELQQVDPRIDASIYEVLGPEKAVRLLVSFGSGGPQRVEEQIRYWKDKLSL